MKIYISGKVTGEKDYKAKFFSAFTYLTKTYDCLVINPVNLAVKVDAKYHFPQWHHYMKECLHWLPVCDKIYMLKGWWKSKGARIEWILAKILKIEIMYQ